MSVITSYNTAIIPTILAISSIRVTFAPGSVHVPLSVVDLINTAIFAFHPTFTGKKIVTGIPNVIFQTNKLLEVVNHVTWNTVRKFDIGLIRGVSSAGGQRRLQS